MPVRIGLQKIEMWNESLEDQVRNYEKEEIQKGQIVFYGPSYFTRWSKRYDAIPLAEALPGASGRPCCINRGFGSSSAEHQLYYYPRMVRPLEPGVLVYSFFGNGGNFGYSNEESWELAQRVIAYTRTDFPDAVIYICGVNPQMRITEESVQRRYEFDSWLKAYAEQDDHCRFVDQMNVKAFWNEKLYLPDGVHFNPEGYLLYGEFFREVLKDELAKY